jgi:hypothetical protein
MVPPLFLIEPFKPILNQLERGVVLLVKSDPPMLGSRDETGLLQHAQVTRRRRPRMPKTSRYLPGRHLAASEMDRHQDLATRRVTQSSQDCVELLEPFLCLTSRH